MPPRPSSAPHKGRAQAGGTSLETTRMHSKRLTSFVPIFATGATDVRDPSWVIDMCDEGVEGLGGGEDGVVAREEDTFGD